MKRTKEFVEWHNRKFRRVHGKISKSSQCHCLAGETWDYASSPQDAECLFKVKLHEIS